MYLALVIAVLGRRIMELPSDLSNYLSKGLQLDYDFTKVEAGKVGLCNIGQIKLGVIWLEPNDESEDTYFEIPAINLTNHCEEYDPEYLLLWLPNENLYGSWDCDHWVLTIFPDATWGDIVQNPSDYLNAQWNPNNSIGKTFDPHSTYKLKSGRPF